MYRDTTDARCLARTAPTLRSGDDRKATGGNDATGAARGPHVDPAGTESKAEGKAEQLPLQQRKRFVSEADSVARRLQAATAQDLDRWALCILDARSLSDLFGDD